VYKYRHVIFKIINSTRIHTSFSPRDNNLEEINKAEVNYEF